MTEARHQRRLAVMRVEVLAECALPRADRADVSLTAQWAAFICLTDDLIDEHGLGAVPGELERFTAGLRQALVGEGPALRAANPHAAALAGLWERTAETMSDRWRERFRQDYGDFLDVTEQEVALRRDGVRLPLAHYLRLRRRTITLQPMLNVLERTRHAPLVEHPLVDDRLRELQEAAADIAGWANDLASAVGDAAAGHDNLVTVLAREAGCTTAVAVERVTAMIERRRAGFDATAQALRTASGLPDGDAAAVPRYVDLVEAYKSAALHWLAATGRFVPPPADPGPAPERP
ncbi:terpene synthase family protein [Kitasatospora sp. NPDC058218]|uniref:terpene synthase family protein n=1 Tax=Kitasatospora sp. NPDC058218 TaxID=3346385 RepID=UPI0036D75C0C